MSLYEELYDNRENKMEEKHSAAYRGREGQIGEDRYTRHAIDVLLSCPFARNCMTTEKTKWKTSTPVVL